MSRVTAWYVSHGSGTPARGPFATDLVRAMLRDGQLNAMDLVYREGEPEWRPASMFAELRNVSNASISSTQHPVDDSDLPDTPAPPVQNLSDRSGSETDISWIVLRPHSSTYLQEGPFKTNYIREGLKKGTFHFGQYAWHIGMKQWMRIGDLREFDRRSSPRDPAPHVPPPLPDPISAVLLEDDGDFESEEFHISLRPSKYDATPTDPSIIFSSEKASVALGGAAAVNFDSNGEDLARVPWEERIPASDHSGTFAQAVELIDDESSFAGYPESHLEGQTSHRSSQQAVQFHDVDSRESLTPQPFIPPPAVSPSANRPKDNWEKWGRYVAAVGMGAVTAVFAGHLLTYKSPASASHVRRNMAPKETGIGFNNVVALSEPSEQVAIPIDPSVRVRPLEKTRSGLDMEDPMAGPEGGFPSGPATSQGAAAVTGAAGSLEASIVGLKLATQDAQVLLQGAFPSGQPISVTFRGRLGEVLTKLNVLKTVVLTKSGAEIPSIKLKEAGLPEGAYTVEVSAGALQLKSDIFFGKRDARFLDRLEAHLREKAFELQSQKKTLFYAAQELDSLARDLGLNYGQLRSKPEMWEKFYSKWKPKVAAVERSIADVAKRGIEEQAYPDETQRLSSLLQTLKETSGQFAQGVGAQRDVASDALADLISELTRQKEAIGSATSRANPSAVKGASSGPTSKAL